MKIMAFTEAIEFFRDKVAMTPAEYDALVASVGEYANSMAFTVSRITSADVLQGLHDAISRAIEEGTTFWDFREDVDALMEKLGWEGMAPYRLDNLYRTNVQTAYNVGRHKQMKAIANRRPYWEYDAVNDSRTRPSHLAQDGKIYHNTHPFWDTWYPPNGYRCFPPWTEVLTKSGWKKMGSILSQDRVIGGSGDEKRVTAIHRNRFDGQLIRLVLENGRIDATPNHRILTMRGWVRADELDTSDILVETSPMAFVNSFVGNKNVTDTKSGNSSMALPVERKPAMPFTTDSEIQRRNKGIQPFGSNRGKNDMVMNNIKTKTFDMLNSQGLRPGWRGFASSMFGWISSDNKPVGDGIFLPDFRPSRGGNAFKFLGKLFSSWIVILGLSQMPVKALFLALKIKGSQLFAIIFPAIFRGMEPLSFNGVAAFSGCDLIMSDKPYEGVVGDLPASTKHPVRKLFNSIKSVESIDDAAPLNRFDSFDGFRAWAGSHCILRNIKSIEKVSYNGIVVNLSVETDESYIIQGATVHNCRCRVNSLSVAEMGEEGLTESTQGTDLKPDEGFDFNPAEQKWKPDLSRYSDGLRNQVSSDLEPVFD